jgi:hypothetical protein
MNINKNFSNPLAIANVFNTYFSSVAGNLIKNSFAKTLTNRVDPLIYLKKNFSQPVIIPQFHWKFPGK